MRKLREQCIEKRKRDAKLRAFSKVWGLSDRTCREAHFLQFRDISDWEKHCVCEEMVKVNGDTARLTWEAMWKKLDYIDWLYRNVHYSENELREHLTRTFI